MKTEDLNKLKLSKDGKTLIRAPKGHEGEFVIPASVTTIGFSAFRGCDKITSVVIPESVSTIDNHSFAHSCLTEIDIPQTVKVIKSTAFAHCKDLKKVTFHEGLEEIECEAFEDCPINVIVIPKTVTSIHELAFEGCNISSLVVEEGNPMYDSRNNCNAIIETKTNTIIVGCNKSAIPPTIEVIGDKAFWTCMELERVCVPKSVVNIGEEAFGCCPGLKKMIVEEGNPIYDSRDNCNAIIETATDTLIAGCSQTVIPLSAKTIGKAAFIFCHSLIEIFIPDNIQEIGEQAFCGCHKLKSVRLPQNLKHLSFEVFCDCFDLEDIVLPEGLESIGNYVFGHCKQLTKVDIPHSVKSIGKCFCSEMTSLSIPENVSEIHPQILIHSTLLKNIEVSPKNLIYDSRENCNAIIETATDTLIAGYSKSKIPASVKHIGAGAFYYSTIKNVAIPEGVISIGDRTFMGCDKLTTVTLPNSLQSIGNEVFDYSNLKRIIIPKGQKKRFVDMGLEAYKDILVEK